MMKFGVVFIVLSIISIARDVEGTLFFDFVRELIFPRRPVVNRVSRIQDAHGDPFAVLDTVGLIEQHGYPAEEHRLTTEDGYNIVFFRIPGGPKSPPTTGKPVVFLQHGMFCSSDIWVLMGPDSDLAFLLADAGYDVWIGNIRGNTYCRSHTNLTTLDKEFWNFSWHEMGTMDLSKTIDYALEHSLQKKFSYIGHSTGTTMFYVLLTEMPEYNDKLHLVISLAPVALWKHEFNSFYQLIFQNDDFIKILFDVLDIYDLGPQTKNNAALIWLLCNDGSPLQPLCLSVFSMVFGEPIERLNTSLLGYLASYFPAGTSGVTLYHYLQCINSGVFQKFDHGPAKNLRVYGMKKSPIYDLSKISAPVALIYGNTDVLSMPMDVNDLSKLFPNLVTCEAVPAPVFNHVDFLLSKNAEDLLYKRILELVALHLK